MPHNYDSRLSYNLSFPNVPSPASTYLQATTKPEHYYCVSANDNHKDNYKSYHHHHLHPCCYDLHNWNDYVHFHYLSNNNTYQDCGHNDYLLPTYSHIAAFDYHQDPSASDHNYIPYRYCHKDICHHQALPGLQRDNQLLHQDIYRSGNHLHVPGAT